MCLLCDDILTLVGKDVLVNREIEIQIKQVKQRYRGVVRHIDWLSNVCEYLQTDTHRWSPSILMNWGGWLSLGFETPV
jgi:hypothetical protein